jgi:succinyl-CoA synthetase beta subunit
MEIHEYQAKELLRQKGVVCPPFFVAHSVEEVEKLIRQHNLTDCVVKVQIHAGGRGKAGGVKRAKSPEEILAIAKELFGKKIINEQTGPAGLTATTLMLTSPVAIVRECYLASAIDRGSASCLLLASKAGGVDVERAKEGGGMLREKISISTPLTAAQFDRIAAFLGFEGTLRDECRTMLTGIREAFFTLDATLVEINPLAVTEDGHLIAIDAKVTIDDDALFRHPDLAALEDPTQRPPVEYQAKKKGLAYVKLDGTIACMVNGAGLAMATIDLITEKGGEAANFLDVGGVSSPERITDAFDLLFTNNGSKVYFINIFGSNVSCAVIAEAIKKAIMKRGDHTTFVIRLEGYGREEARLILKRSGFRIIFVDTFDEGAEKAASLAKGAL